MKPSPIHLLSFLLLAPLALADSKQDWETLKGNGPLQERINAAKLIGERAKKDHDCGKVAGDLIDIAHKFTTPPELKTALSDAVSSCDGEDTAKALIPHIGKGQPAERSWSVRTARGIHSADLDKALTQKALTDEELAIREEAVDVLVAHKCTASIPQFESILKSSKDTELLGPIVSGISTMVEGTPGWNDWETRLIEYAKSKIDTVRRGACVAGEAEEHRAPRGVHRRAAEHGLARALAVDYLRRATEESAGAIIEQMKNEPPGTRMIVEIVSV
jgi:hypothetical protein